MTASDIQALVDGQVRETRDLDYKSELPGNSYDAKKEFLKDATSFANTEGGLLIFGVETGRDERGQDTGVPLRVVGLRGANLDNEVRRLTDILRTGAWPGVGRQARFREIDMGEPGPILVLRLPRSLEAPHRIIFQGSNRFWRRSENSKYEPDVPELRQMFLESATWLEDAARFHSQRSTDLTAEVASDLLGTPFALVHLLPIGRLNLYFDLRPWEEEFRRKMTPLVPRGLGYNWTWNEHGFRTITALDDRLSYSQCFRFGGIEGFTSHIWHETPHRNGGNVRLLRAQELLSALPDWIAERRAFLETALGLSPPWVVMITLAAVRGCVVPVNLGHFSRGQIGPNVVRLSMIVLDEETDFIEQLCRRFDVLWQAAGVAGVPEDVERALKGPRAPTA